MIVFYRKIKDELTLYYNEKLYNPMMWRIGVTPFLWQWSPASQCGQILLVLVRLQSENLHMNKSYAFC